MVFQQNKMLIVVIFFYHAYLTANVFRKFVFWSNPTKTFKKSRDDNKCIVYYGSLISTEKINKTKTVTSSETLKRFIVIVVYVCIFTFNMSDQIAKHIAVLSPKLRYELFDCIRYYLFTGVYFEYVSSDEIAR